MLLLAESIPLPSEWPQVGHSQRVGPPRSGDSPGVTPTGQSMKLKAGLCYKLPFGAETYSCSYEGQEEFFVQKLPSVHPMHLVYVPGRRCAVQDDCYYSSYVEGDPESLVSLNNCLKAFRECYRQMTLLFMKLNQVSAFGHLLYKLNLMRRQIFHILDVS